ncbi:putative PTH11-typeG-protein-coupled receptor [Trichoderma velutinum]
MDTPPASILDRNDNSSQSIYIPSAIFLVIAPFIVLLRVYDRYHRRELGRDDWIAVAALIFQVLTIAFLLASCQYGMGRHSADISYNNKTEIFKYFYFSQITYKFAINCSKCSILLLYLRIFEPILWMKRTCWVLLVCIAIYCLSSVAATVFQCSPTAKAFDKALPGTCIDLAKFWLSNAGFSIATDIIILVIPIPQVYTLRHPRARKISLILVFAIGIFVVIASCLRATTLDMFADSADSTYYTKNLMWTIIECSVTIMCSSLQPLSHWIIRCMISTNHRSGEDIHMNSANTAGEDASTLQRNDLEAGPIPGRPHSNGTAGAGSTRSYRSEERILETAYIKDEEVSDGNSNNSTPCL